MKMRGSAEGWKPLICGNRYAPDGNLAVSDDREVIIQVEGGTLLGMDNGNPKDHTLYAAGHRRTFHGLAYAVIRKNRTAGTLTVRISASGLEEQVCRVAAGEIACLN